jgi:hypothetical protein
MFMISSIFCNSDSYWSTQYDGKSPLTAARSRELQHISKLLDEISYQTHATYLLISPLKLSMYMLYLFLLFCYKHDLTKTSYVDISLVPAPSYFKIILSGNERLYMCCYMKYCIFWTIRCSGL